MSTLVSPKIESWYELPDGKTFRVVSIDDNDDSIEIIYFDGMLEEIDSEIWTAMDAQAIVPPKDWSGLFDDYEFDEDSYQSKIDIPDSEWLDIVEEND